METTHQKEDSQDVMTVTRISKSVLNIDNSSPPKSPKPTQQVQMM